MIMPFAAGGLLDTLARILLEGMRQSLGQPVIVENVTGADGSIGLGRVARARPDGYTIDFAGLGQHVLNGALYSLSYDVLNDFAPIIPLISTSLMLVGRKTMPAKDLKELIGWLKANSDKVSVGIAGAGQRLAMMSFSKEIGTQLTLVSYRGGALERQDLVAGQIDLMLDTPDGLPLAWAGSVKAYAVTGEMRLATAPDIPTFRELGVPVSWCSGTVFSHPRVRREISSQSSMRRPWKRSPTWQCALGSPISGWRLSLANGRRRRRVKADVAKWWPRSSLMTPNNSPTICSTYVPGGVADDTLGCVAVYAAPTSCSGPK
jgi:tripartite-type tricarboxylate transporter receptor subunit TctC